MERVDTVVLAVVAAVREVAAMAAVVVDTAAVVVAFTVLEVVVAQAVPGVRFQMLASTGLVRIPRVGSLL